MIILTDQGIILVPPEQNFTGYFQAQQFRKFQAFVDAEEDLSQAFSWVQAEVEE